MTAPIVDVAIVGGGMAGLSAAWELQQRGLQARVLEASTRAGGVVTTERFDGWVIDGGPDALLIQKPAALALCRELGLQDRLHPTLPPRTSYILRGGRLHPLVEGSFLGFPLSATSLARSTIFSWPGKLRMAMEVLMPVGGSADESIGAFIRRRFGQEAVSYLADPMLAGIHAGDVEKLSLRALFPRFAEAERSRGSVLRAFRALQAKPAPNGAFMSLPGGTAELAETLAGALTPGTVVCNARVTSIQRGTTYTLEHAGGVTESRAVILAAPAYVTASLVRPLNAGLATLCDSVPYASTATVAFGYRRDQVAHPMRGTGFLVPKVEPCALLAGTWVSSKWPGRAPDGHVLLRGFLGGGRDPHRLDASDEELIALARTELTRLLGISGPPLFARLFRWTRQSPQFEVGHLDTVRAIDGHLADMPGLFVAGSGFRAIGIPDCVADGREMAGRAAAHLATLSSGTL